MQTNRFIGRESLSRAISECAKEIEAHMVEPETGLLVVFEEASFAWPGQNPVEPFYVARITTTYATGRRLEHLTRF